MQIDASKQMDLYMHPQGQKTQGTKTMHMPKNTRNENHTIFFKCILKAKKHQAQKPHTHTHTQTDRHMHASSRQQKTRQTTKNNQLKDPKSQKLRGGKALRTG
jgi:hypothetical protein